MTRDAFKKWADTTVRYFTDEGTISKINRDFAVEIREYDPKLADLYVKLAEASEAIRKHLVARAGSGR